MVVADRVCKLIPSMAALVFKASPTSSELSMVRVSWFITDVPPRLKMDDNASSCIPMSLLISGGLPVTIVYELKSPASKNRKKNPMKSKALTSVDKLSH
jgi:hypothetical protein